MKRIVVAVALALVSVFPLTAQEPAPVAGEVIEVLVTNLDVVVTDSKGKRVTGLTKDDFEVIEDGKAQVISNLSEVSRTTGTLTETIQPAPRRILLIVDNGTIALAARRKVFDATRAALDRLLIGPSDRISVATISRSVQQRLGWTSDKAEVLKMLAEIEKDATLPDPNLLAFERLVDSLMDDANAAAQSQPLTDRDGNEIPGSYSGTPKSGAGGSRSLPPIDFAQFIATGRNYASSATNETKQTVSSLNAVLDAFADVPGGRKIAILVGGGLPLNSADAIFQRIESVREQLELNNHRGVKGMRNSSMLTQISAYDITPLVDSLAAAARLKGVAFYAVNPEFGGRQSGSVASRTVADGVAQFAATKGMLDGYNRLATATGGAAMIGRPADQILNEIVNDLESYYSLGYRGSGPLTSKSQIVVKVKNGLSARMTLAPGAISRDSEVADQVLAENVPTAPLGEPENPLNISVLMEPAVAHGDKRTIPMKILIPVESLDLVQEGSEYTASVTIFISLGDAAGKFSEPNRHERSYRWPEDAVEDVRASTIRLSLNLDVPADRDRLSVGVLDHHSGAAGYTRVMLQ